MAKKMSPLAWIAIGCGGLVLIGFIIFAVVLGWGANQVKNFVEEAEGNPTKAAAELAIRLNPDYDLVSSDDEDGTLTYRINSTGEEVTLDWQDIADGNFSVTTSEGTTTYSTDTGEDGGSAGVTVSGADGSSVRYGAQTGTDDLPEWVPIHPTHDEVTQALSANAADGTRSGMLSYVAEGSEAEVVDFYRESFADAGCETSEASFSSGEGKLTTLTCKGARQVTAQVTTNENEIRVNVQYNGKDD